MHTKKFLISTAILTAGMTAITLITQIFINKFFSPTHYITTIITAILTALTYLLTQKKAANSFVNFFMAATIIKLFSLTIYIIIGLFILKATATPFLTFILINYFVFTLLEVIFLLKKTKPKNLKK